MGCLSTTEHSAICPGCKESFIYESKDAVKQDLKNTKIAFPKGLYYVTCSKCSANLGFTYNKNHAQYLFVLNPLIKRKWKV